MKRIVTSLLFVGIATVHAQDSMKTVQYIREFTKFALREKKKAGIPAAITLAQGVYETGAGESFLAKKAKNHFGIKWKKGRWDIKKTVRHTDDLPRERFCKYTSASESYAHRSIFLKGERYVCLFDIDQSDYVGWANGLYDAGYATNPLYAEKLIGIIKKYRLYELDIELQQDVSKK